MITTVSTAAALQSALAVARAGDVIQLASGTYGTLSAQNLKFAGEVTITSADPSHQAVIHYLDVAGSQNITFKGIEVLPYSDSSGGYVRGSTNITFDNVYFHGNLDGNAANDGQGLATSGNTNLVVKNSEFRELVSGVTVSGSDGVAITNNYIHLMAVDGVQVTSTSNIAITKNYITDMQSDNMAHKDAIQFFTSGQKTNASNITITDNTITRGNGEVVQGIFMGNEGGVSYKNVVIARNAIVGEAYHGITIEKVEGLHIDDNLVQGYSDYTSWIKVNDSWGDVSIANNKATAYVLTDLKQGGAAQGWQSYTPVNDATIASQAVGNTSVLKAWEQLAGHATLTAASHLVSAALAPVVAPPVVAPPVVVPPVVVPPVVTVPAAPANLVLVGTAGVDKLTGGAGNDDLDGKAGADIMTGGAGNDVYHVDNILDQAIEAVNGGIDTVITTAMITGLGANIENGILAGTSAQQIVGNALNNVLTGNAVQSSLFGGDGNDTLVSAGGVDTLFGGSGADTFSFTKMPKAAARIVDFQRGVDHLDLHPLLSNYHGSDAVADGYVKFVSNAISTSVYVDIDGAKGSAGFTLVTTMDAVTQPLKAGSDWLF